MKRLVYILLIILITQNPSFSAHIRPEKYYQTQWCSRWNGQAEYILPDKTRIDCLTKSYAVEFDFPSKWAEAVGQSLYYAKMTGKKPAIILILEKPSDWKYYERAKVLAKEYNIILWYMKAPNYNEKL